MNVQDIAKDAAPHMRKAKKFYDSIAAELVHHGHAMDMFACALDQVNIHAALPPAAQHVQAADCTHCTHLIRRNCHIRRCVSTDGRALNRKSWPATTVPRYNYTPCRGMSEAWLCIADNRM